jgi:hypothetical protein
MLVDIKLIESNLKFTREILDQFSMKIVFNINETWLFYRL